MAACSFLLTTAMGWRVMARSTGVQTMLNRIILAGVAVILATQLDYATVWHCMPFVAGADCLNHLADFIARVTP
jgi:hypothetical protein